MINSDMPSKNSLNNSIDSLYVNSHLSIDHLQGFKETLLQTIAEKQEMINQVRDEIIENSGAPADPNDHATNTSSLTEKQKMIDRSRIMIDSCTAALVRINEGEYGICGGCDENIPIKRLEARPFAALCIECQESYEKSEKMTGGTPTTTH